MSREKKMCERSGGQITDNHGPPTLRAAESPPPLWLFCSSAAGGLTAAILASFTETCRRHRLNPWRYLTEVLTILPNLPEASLPDQLLALLPDRWAPNPPVPA